MQKRRISVVMSKKEWILGLCWLPFYFLLLSLGVQLIFRGIAGRLPDTAELNAVYYAVNAAVVLLIFRRFLRGCRFRRFGSSRFRRCGISRFRRFGGNCRVRSVLLCRVRYRLCRFGFRGVARRVLILPALRADALRILQRGAAFLALHG